MSESHGGEPSSVEAVFFIPFLHMQLALSSWGTVLESFAFPAQTAVATVLLLHSRTTLQLF